MEKPGPCPRCGWTDVTYDPHDSEPTLWDGMVATADGASRMATEAEIAGYASALPGWCTCSACGTRWKMTATSPPP